MATQKRKFDLFQRLGALGFTYEEAQSLYRIQLTLNNWATEECNGTIQRDETTGKPVRHLPDYEPRPYPIADREAGALKRLAAIIEARNRRETTDNDAGNFVLAYHQGDPRGCSLYLLTREQLKTDSNQIVAKAQSFGAWIPFHDDAQRAPSGCYVVRDNAGKQILPGTFNTEELAAEAFLKSKGASIPARDLLPVSSYYTRGLAVCA